MESIVKKVIVRISVAVLSISLIFGTCVFAASSGKITAENVNFRKSASASSKVYKLLDKGAKVTILGTKGNWKKVKISGKVGYVSGQFVSKSTATKKTVTRASSSRTSYISVSKANLRSKASLKSGVIKVYKRNSKVTILGSKGDWYKVKISGKTGYIRKDMVKSGSTNRGESTRTSSSSLADRVVDYALRFKGCQYVYGGDSPSGFDCSGFVRYVYKNFNIDLPHSSSGMSGRGKQVSKSDLQKGDLLFFRRGGASIGHVAIYIGGGKMIHAENTRSDVNIDPVFDGDYYQRNFVKAMRVID